MKNNNAEKTLRPPHGKKQKIIFAFVKRNLIILIILAVLILSDLPLAYANPVGKSRLFWPNDFEITQRLHPEKIWDKVFFGNSSIIAAYDDMAGGDYLNLGLDYGLITDLKVLIEKKYIKIGSELVLGLNFLTLYDNFETNKTYIWHKNFYEPYVYFERDRLYNFISSEANALLEGKPFLPDYSDAKKETYSGNLSDDELEIKRESFHKLYWELPLSDFQKNLDAIDWLTGYCAKRSITLKVVWMPWNPKLEVPDIAVGVMAAANEKFAGAGIEIINLTDLLTPEYFYDFGHLTIEAGRPIFTEYINNKLAMGDGYNEILD